MKQAKTYTNKELMGQLTRNVTWEVVKYKGKAWDNGKLVKRNFEYSRQIHATPWVDEVEELKAEVKRLKKKCKNKCKKG